MFAIVNAQPISDVSQCSVGGIEERVRTCIVLWPYPFAFKDSPKRFGYVQVRRIWWEKEDEEPSLLPYQPAFFYPPVAMHRGIVKHDKGFLADAERTVVKETDNLVRRHPLRGGKALVLVLAGYHYEDVEPCDPPGGNEHILSFQLPPVWHITLRTGMALVGIEECYTPLCCLTFKFLQLPDLIPV